MSKKDDLIEDGTLCAACEKFIDDETFPVEQPPGCRRLCADCGADPDHPHQAQILTGVPK